MIGGTHDATPAIEKTPDPVSLAAVWLRLLVLEERIAGIIRGEDSREARLVAVEVKIDGVLEKIDRNEKASWGRFVALIGVVLAASVGMAAYIGQMLLQHIALTGGAP